MLLMALLALSARRRLRRTSETLGAATPVRRWRRRAGRRGVRLLPALPVPISRP
ncbi:hypothetical protein ACFZAR_25540 [Streptomyces sp. NPDC008222]|uniref:hypothetical protein n=1 Tax=Streptomyces sp. NPDC008222 TaxID=3364820 RepID=UPI0036E5337E